MDINTYQQKTNEFAIYPSNKSLEYLTLGLTSEAGELAGKVKKVIRDNRGVVDSEVEAAMIAEIGDCAWYLSELCNHFHIKLSDVLQANIDKLQSRKSRNVLGGSGDVR